MSDGISEASRGDSYSDIMDYFSALARYLAEPGSETRKRILEAAQKTSAYRRGIEERLRLLESGSKEEWAEVLAQAKNRAFTEAFEKLKKLSPFHEQALLHVSYGYGFVRLGDLEEIITGRLRQLDLPIGECDDYLLVLPPEVLNQIQVVWFKCDHTKHLSLREKYTKK
ncbi:MAG: hypothetical protein A2754_00455 [Candidatus Magasanikbacteria bacterium RIFCSPHIGHO2_01_FULL_47_8]|uniref:Uncharacterized protein n=1 Tax=Candidatus Magasanikbacteria bacterium RIFCSPHIGHO2_01_FULL_47_8 TaxID=1798673 RepID=A0A1F6MCC9_9BACT|nr:MAG: hypothetical protein A2754_00455 [Candidatus Magasanikbacteria bacterium RIFCSPHIGHO2_01_FULL_47_8]